ncbi:MAG TPA: glycosyltransferase family 4 protein [Thermoanaerobaculia bacterium]|nr:glycosyltransferase family 4 protein [Thermoanaerobaculia bacterium]
MRIAFHVPRAWFIGGGHSGDHVLVESLFQALQAAGHEVEFVSRLDARDFWREKAPLRRLLAEAFAVRRRMKQFSPDAWLVYSPSVTYPDFFGWWLRPRRYVLYAAAKGRPERLPTALRWLYVLAHRLSLRRADAVAAFRPAVAERLRAGSVDPEKVHVLPPAVQPWETVPSREEARGVLGVAGDAPVVLCVSRLSRPMNHGRPGKTEMILDLLDALAPLPAARLLLVGDGKGRAAVEKRVAEKGLTDRVRLAGSVEDVRPYFAACDVYAYPHPLDRVWVSVLEAQACGRPVVTMRTDSGEISIQDGRTGLLANDLDEFRENLGVLTSDRARCERMGEKARDFIARSHTIGVRVGQLEALLSGRAPGPAA